MQASLLHLWSNLKDDTLCHEWCEVDNIKYLFRPQQKWGRAQAFTFVDEAWSYVGVR